MQLIAVHLAFEWNWGCATEAGIYVAGVLYSSGYSSASVNKRRKMFLIKNFRHPFLPFESSPDWDEVIRRMSQNTKDILDVGRSQASAHPTTIDKSAETVTFFPPGFSKSEEKLSQACVSLFQWF
jgi:hypothetical protein